MNINEERAKRHLHIKPLVSGAYIAPVDPFKTAYTWSAVAVMPAFWLKDITTITAKSYGYYGLFKPSIGEVIDCIDDSLIDKVHAFKIIDSTVRISDGGGGQTFQVQLYGHTWKSKLWFNTAGFLIFKIVVPIGALIVKGLNNLRDRFIKLIEYTHKE